MSHITDYMPEFETKFNDTPEMPELLVHGFVRDADGDYWNGLEIFYYSAVNKKFVFCRSSKSENEYFNSVDEFIKFYTK